MFQNVYIAHCKPTRKRLHYNQNQEKYKFSENLKEVFLPIFYDCLTRFDLGKVKGKKNCKKEN